MKKRYALSLISFLFFFVGACGEKADINSQEPEQTEEKEQQEPEQVQQDEPEEVVINDEATEIDLTDFAEEVGFSMEAPSVDLQTIMPLKGNVERADELTDDYVWVTVRKTDHIEEIKNKEFNQYIPIQDGAFQAELNLHHGEGDYRVTVRVPDFERENYFYDVANFKVRNVDDDIARDVEYSNFGIEKELALSSSVAGWNEATEMIEISGTVSEQYRGDVLLAEVKKDGEKNQIAIPIRDHSFQAEVPLYYGKGTHEIQLHLYTDDPDEREGTYYDSALLYVNNTSDKIFPEITQYGTYLESGLMLESPGWNSEKALNEIEYPIKGTIDKNAPKADTVSHVIVKVQHLDVRQDVATYYFPVEDYQFEGMTHFRFGPGEYEVTVHVPEGEQKRSFFRFMEAFSIKHDVTGIEDQRDILPANGIESDDEEIIKKAQEITKGIKGEREKALAIFKFVAQHVKYDVEKFRDNVLEPDDSAIATLESGTGICQDYAYLTIALLRSIDIEARYVTGNAGGRHAWVEANLDGEWIEMDPTWGAGYVQNNEFHFEYNEDYFDPDPDFLAETHTRQGLMY